jgi:hypothetical protein
MSMIIALSAYDHSTDEQGAIRVPPVILYQPITNDVPALDAAVRKPECSILIFC